ncbi:TetR/AcrR family transcriptional regulator [Jidongwangia harbinensis]|uniref:TetR/AcrR family transcriptional regulator n=1 Tax=Jidongwangia harbinensis TaxID=2878561 RepID=UPI001CD96F6F|nr:TetR/AcrR family transcriptional regulator [Jidongwangia harbinensis]MCA2214622.1 TetR/AcrR family transcriptional regulator [Jidongwangia harbinensis]
MPRAGLTTGAVVDVALALVDEKGPDALSLAAVADRAGVAAPSLYKHVGSLADLRDLIALKALRQATARFAAAVMGRGGDQAVEALMRTYREYVREFPSRYRLIPLDPLHSPDLAEAGRELLAVFVAVMHEYGLDDAAATHAIRRMRAAAHGFADLEARGGFGMPEDIETSYDQVIDMVLRSLREPPAGGIAS